MYYFSKFDVVQHDFINFVDGLSIYVFGMWCDGSSDMPGYGSTINRLDFSHDYLHLEIEHGWRFFTSGYGVANKQTIVVTMDMLDVHVCDSQYGNFPSSHVGVWWDMWVILRPEPLFCQNPRIAWGKIKPVVWKPWYVVIVLATGKQCSNRFWVIFLGQNHQPPVQIIGRHGRIQNPCRSVLPIWLWIIIGYFRL